MSDQNPVEPPATQFEQQLSTTVDELMKLGKTGYVWGPVDALLKAELGIEGLTRCKKAGGSGRAANVLTESNDKPIALYLVFAAAPYTIQQFRSVAKDRIARFPNVRCVAVADRSSGLWRVREIIERAGVDLAPSIRGHFPAVSDAAIEIVPANLPRDEAQPPAVVPAEDEGVFALAAAGYFVPAEDLSSVVPRFRAYCQQTGVEIDLSTAVDVLAATLGSQFLLFAGPSGTGKSTLARLLIRFFAPDEKWPVVEARRQWLGPEDLFGYYSPLTNYYALTPDTQCLIEMHESSARLTTGGAQPIVPFLLIEEINLSPIEGYLAPMVHGLSAPSAPHVKWPLHAQASGATDAEGTLLIPRTALLGPFPRLFGTINVDQNSQAPARKVAARATVLLLEPSPGIDPETAAASLTGTGAGGIKDENPAEAGTRWLGDPATARARTGIDGVRDMLTVLSGVVDLTTKPGDTPVVQLSRRDLARCANFMAYFVGLCVDLNIGAAGAPEVRRIAAENALLHFVLPGLSPESFRQVVLQLLASKKLTPAPSADTLGGLLLPRLERLAAALDRYAFSEALDFWTSLS